MNLLIRKRLQFIEVRLFTHKYFLTRLWIFDSGLCFPSVMLVKEILGDPSHCLSASRISPGDLSNDNNDGVFWMVEEHCAKFVQKYSGTMDHRCSMEGLKALTIYVFAHFMYLWSQVSIVVVDIQGIYLYFSFTPCSLRYARLTIFWW